MTDQIKSGYITGENTHLQELRPYLVEQGFVDDKEWNDNRIVLSDNAISISRSPSKTVGFCLFEGWLAKIGATHLYTLSPNEDLREAARKIKEAFYKG